MKKRVILTTLLMMFMVTVPAKADFWKKLKNAVIGSGSSSSNSSGKSRGTRGYLVKDSSPERIVNPFDTNNYRTADSMYSAERNAIYEYRNLQGTTERVNYVECRMKPGNFLEIVGNSTYFGYVKFPIYNLYSAGALGCFQRDKSGKETELSYFDIYVDHDLAMAIWDNQLTVQTFAMKNGKKSINERKLWFDSTDSKILINGEEYN